MQGKFNWQDAAKIVLALVVTGFVWMQENQAGVLALAAMLIVWLVKFYTLKTGKQIGKFGLTIALLVVSVGLAILFQPVAIPAFPIWGGELVGFVSAVLTWLAALVVLGGEVFAIATGLYNILLAKVLEKLQPEPTLG
jgi:hypothetical protein